MATEDQILLKLVIQGQDPAEIQRLAASTQGELNAKIKVYLDQLTELHRQAREAQTADAVNTAKKQIDVAEKQIETIAKVARANEIAANRSGNAWRQTLEVMENIATSATFMYGIVSSGLSRFEKLGEEIDKVTNVYHSLKGSIDEMREAARGEVSDFDLIATKNRALEKDLELTDKQFGLVASAADNFADAIGTNTKEALDKMIDGLAQGRLKSLAQAGVIIDSTKAFAEYAKSIGVSADQLSEHGKRMAIVQAALDKLAEKSKAAGGAAEDFSHEWEKMTAELDNSRKAWQLWLGEIAVDTWHGLKDIPQALALQFARIKDVITLGTQDYEKAFLEKVGHENDARDALTKMAGQKFRRYGQDINPDDFLHPGGAYAGVGDRADSINAAKVAEDAKKAEEAQRKQDALNSMFDNFLRKMGGLDKSTLGGGEGLDALAGRVQTAEERAIGQSYNPYGSQNALLGLNNSTARTQALAKAQADRQQNIARSMEAPNETNDLSRGIDSKGAMDRMEKSLKAAQDRMDDLRKRAGDGVLSDMFFGTDGPAGMNKKIETFAQSAADAVGMVSDAGRKMGAALGESLAAFVSGSQSKSIRQQTHDILEALATQAYAQSIFKTAQGLGALGEGFMGNPAAFAAASQFFSSAAMFAVVGTGAALTARAVGTDPKAAAAKSGGASSGSGISSTNSGSGGFGSNGQRSSQARSDQPIVININSTFGDKVSIGRAVNDALHEYNAQTGQGVPAAMVAA